MLASSAPPVFFSCAASAFRAPVNSPNGSLKRASTSFDRFLFGSGFLAISFSLFECTNLNVIGIYQRCHWLWTIVFGSALPVCQNSCNDSDRVSHRCDLASPGDSLRPLSQPNNRGT